MPLSLTKITEYMQHGLNIYITGKAGTGKTEVLKAAAKKNNLCMGYMSAPTLDAYVDLVGIPVAKMDKQLKKRVLKFIRKQDFDDIEVLFIDELPRGELKTLNAIFEIVQFGTINGEVAMPKLKCVVAAGNPMTDEYQGQQELDEALLDRFDMYLETDTDADRAYFIGAFGADIGKALVNWHKGHDHEANGYLSPRRLEKIGKTWLKMPEISTIKAMVPPGGRFNVQRLQDDLERARAKGLGAQAVSSTAPIWDQIPYMSTGELRNKREDILRELPQLDARGKAQVTEALAKGLQRGFTVDGLLDNWKVALEYFSHSDRSALFSGWTASKNSEFLQKASEKKVSLGKNLVSPDSVHTN